MSILDTSYSLRREERHDCRSCGTSIPDSDMILQKLKRCHHCGKRHPFGGNWKRLVPLVIAAMAAVTIWWGHPPL
jgi:hypothetical protein